MPSRSVSSSAAAAGSGTATARWSMALAMSRILTGPVVGCGRWPSTPPPPAPTTPRCRRARSRRARRTSSRQCWRPAKRRRGASPRARRSSTSTAPCWRAPCCCRCLRGMATRRRRRSNRRSTTRKRWRSASCLPPTAKGTRWGSASLRWRPWPPGRHSRRPACRSRHGSPSPTWRPRVHRPSWIRQARSPTGSSPMS